MNGRGHRSHDDADRSRGPVPASLAGAAADAASSLAGATAVVLAGAGVTYAAAGSDQNQVGTAYPNGIQVSDNQIIKPVGRDRWWS